MINGIDVQGTEEFVCASDTGDPKTVFTLGTLTGRQMLALFSSEGEGAMMLAAFRSGVRKITGLCVDGAPRDFDTITDEVIDLVPFEALAEVATRIIKVVSHDKALEKNSQ